MPEIKWSKTLGYVASTSSLFVLIALYTNILTSIITTACFVLGYFNEFSVFRFIVSLLRKGWQSASKGELIVVVISLTGDFAVIYYGYGLILGLTIFCFFVIDAFALRFK